MNLLVQRTGLALLLVVLVLPAAAQDTRYYDNSGRVLGRSESRDDTTRFYDNAGRATGRAERRGDTTRYYDTSGRAEGRAEARGGTTRH